MKQFIAAAVLAFVPLKVVSDEAAVQCDTAWEDIIIFAGALGEGISQAQVETAASGWCAVSATADWPAAPGTIEARFRVDRLVSAPPDARSIELTLEDIQTDVGIFDVSAALSYQVESGALRLHQLAARADDGRGIRTALVALIGAVDQGADAMAVLPALTVSNVNADLFVTPDFLKDARIDLSDLSRITINDALSDVSTAQVSRGARNEFLRFAGATPNARGTLNLSLDAQEGISVAQVIGAIVGLGRDPDDAAIVDVLGDVFKDTVLDLAWKPGRM